MNDSQGIAIPGLGELALGECLSQTASKFPDNIAVIYKGRRITYRELDELTDNAAKGLLSIGAKKGDHIAIWSTDQPNTLISFYAAVKIGAAAVMVNTSLKKAELTALLRDTDVDWLLYGDGYKDVSFTDVCKELQPPPKMKKMVYIGESAALDTLDLNGLYLRGQSMDNDTLNKAKSAVKLSDTAAILFTSGTGGSMKGVMTSHYSRTNNAIIQGQDLEATEKDVFCVAIPMFHCFSLTTNILVPMIVGACVCFPETRHTKHLLDNIQQNRCTVLNAVPTLFYAMTAREDFDSFDLSSLRIGLIGGSLHDPEQYLKLREKMGYEIMPSLGLTEATAGITVTYIHDPIEVKMHTVGHFMKYTEGCTMNTETHEIQQPGQIGEICVRGYNVMQGYYGNDELTRQAIDANGFLHTGDLGYLDSDGNVHFVGRCKEVIIRGGENIYPSEVEQVISKDLRIAAVKVIGLPDKYYGEEVCACVIKKPGEDITDLEIMASVSQALAYYKVPKYVLFLEKFPQTTSGKISLAELTRLVRKNIA